MKKKLSFLRIKNLQKKKSATVLSTSVWITVSTASVLPDEIVSYIKTANGGMSAGMKSS